MPKEFSLGQELTQVCSVATDQDQREEPPDSADYSSGERLRIQVDACTRRLTKMGLSFLNKRR